MSGRLATFLMALIVGIAVPVESHDHEYLCHFLPENDMYIPVGQKANSNGMTEAEFNRVIDNVDRIYKPIIAAMGGTLAFKRSWTNGSVNAQAYQQGRTWWVEMFGGLARHDAVTSDALALVACHEVGHHIGGAPKYTEQGASGTWASVEGQSDYFATLKCLRKVFAADGGSVSNVDANAKSECDRVHGANSANSLICQRIVMAGVSSGNMFGSSSGRFPSLVLRDPARVTKTFESHPQAQCRLDTYFQGAICPVSHTVNVDQRDANVGVCVSGSAQDYGSRPLCWYKPSGVVPNPTPTPPNPNPTPTPNPVPTPVPQPGDLAIAATPLLNGGTSLQSANPNAPITVTYDVSSFAGVYGVYFEISGANMSLPQNGVTPGKAWRSFSFVGARGQFVLVPQQGLPGWGSYQIRVIPLDRSGRKPVGQFSNSAQLVLTPQLRFK